MSEEIKINSPKGAPETVVVTPVVSEEEAPVVIEEKAPVEPYSGKAFEEKIPSNWVITSNDDDTIDAFTRTTLEKFHGTRAEFNKALRG